MLDFFLSLQTLQAADMSTCGNNGMWMWVLWVCQLSHDVAEDVSSAIDPIAW